MKFENMFPAEPIDEMIGRLHRVLSEYIIASQSPRDEADRMTLQAHAEGLIEVAHDALENLNAGGGL